MLSDYNDKGNSAVEFALVLPLAVLMIAAAAGFSLTGVRAVATQHAATRAARVASVFQDGLIGAELHASLSPELFRGGIHELEGGRASTSELPGALSVVAVPNGLLDFAGLGMSLLRRDAPVVPALPEGLSDAVLSGGDTPSPYCRGDGGYAVCGRGR